jgi:hypothetical protein
MIFPLPMAIAGGIGNKHGFWHFSRVFWGNVTKCFDLNQFDQIIEEFEGGHVI